MQCLGKVLEGTDTQLWRRRRFGEGKSLSFPDYLELGWFKIFTESISVLLDKNKICRQQEANGGGVAYENKSHSTAPKCLARKDFP